MPSYIIVFFYFKYDTLLPPLNLIFLIYLKGIKFRGNLISRILFFRNFPEFREINFADLSMIEISREI